MEGPTARSDNPDTPAPAKPKTILLVEDDRDLRELAEAGLSGLGYPILTAETGAEATEIWNRHKEEIALLFTDIVMPEGPSGIEIGLRFHQENPRLKILYTSGYQLETIPEFPSIHQTGVFIPKPYIPSQLALLVHRILSDESAPPEFPAHS